VILGVEGSAAGQHEAAFDVEIGLGSAELPEELRMLLPDGWILRAPNMRRQLALAESDSD